MYNEALFEIVILIAIVFIGGPFMFLMLLWYLSERLRHKYETGQKQREIWYDEEGKHW